MSQTRLRARVDVDAVSVPDRVRARVDVDTVSVPDKVERGAFT